MANFDVNGRQLNYDGRAKFPGNFVQSYMAKGDGSTIINHGAANLITGSTQNMRWKFCVDSLTNAGDVVMGEAKDAGNQRGWYIFINSKELFFTLGNSDGTAYSVVNASFTPSLVLADGDCVDVKFQSGVFTATINGSGSYTVDVSATTTTIYNNGANLNLFGTGDSTSFSFDAAMYDVKIWTDNITDNDDPAFHAPLAEGNGTKGYDVSGNDNHGTWIGTVAYNRQDNYHHNICEGCDVYKLDSDPTDVTDYLYVPWKTDGTPATSSVTGYTKIQGNQGFFHNGAETLVKFDPCPENLIFNKNAIVGNSDGLPEIWLATIQGGDWYDVAFGTDYQWMWSYHELNEDYIALHANPDWTGASLSSVTKRMFACGKDIVVDGTSKETLSGYLHNILNYESDRTDVEVNLINNFCNEQNNKIN